MARASPHNEYASPKTVMSHAYENDIRHEDKRELHLLACIERRPISSPEPAVNVITPTYFCPYPDCNAKIRYLPLFRIHLMLHDGDYRKYCSDLAKARSASAANNLQKKGSNSAAAPSSLPMGAKSSTVAHVLPPLPKRPRVPVATEARRVSTLPKRPRFQAATEARRSTLAAPPRATSADVLATPKDRNTEDNPLGLDLELRL